MNSVSQMKLDVYDNYLWLIRKPRNILDQKRGEWSFERLWFSSWQGITMPASGSNFIPAIKVEILRWAKERTPSLLVRWKRTLSSWKQAVSSRSWKAQHNGNDSSAIFELADRQQCCCSCERTVTHSFGTSNNREAAPLRQACERSRSKWTSFILLSLSWRNIVTLPWSISNCLFKSSTSVHKSQVWSSKRLSVSLRGHSNCPKGAHAASPLPNWGFWLWAGQHITMNTTSRKWKGPSVHDNFAAAPVIFWFLNENCPLSLRSERDWITTSSLEPPHTSGIYSLPIAYIPGIANDFRFPICRTHRLTDHWAHFLKTDVM